MLALFHKYIITFCTGCGSQPLRMGNAGYKAVQCNSVHFFVLQLLKLGNFNILRNGLLHHVVSFSGEIGIRVFKQKVFCGTAASLFVQQQTLQLLISAVRYGEAALVPICCNLS